MIVDVRPRALLLLAGFLGVARLAAAQDLDPLAGAADDQASSVVGASRWRQSLQDAPADVTVITAADIRRFGYRTITEVLANVRGLYVSDDHNYSYLGARGLNRPGDYNSRVLVLVNGHAMNDAPYLSSLLGRELGIDMGLVERVEVVRGPGSALYGTNAVLAVINVVTRTAPLAASLEGVGGNVAAEADTLARAKGRATVDRMVLDRGRLLLSASFEHGAGQTYDYVDGGVSKTTSRDSDALDALNTFGAFSYGPLTIQGALNRYRKSVPTGSFGALRDAGEETTDLRAFVESTLALSPAVGLGLTGRLYLDHSRYGATYPYAADEGGIFREGATGTWAGLEVSGDVHVLEPLRLAAGGSAQTYFEVSQTAEQPGANLVVDDRRSFVTWAAFTNAELELTRELHVVGGVRYDHHASFGGRASPRVALVAEPVPGTTVKLIYGEAFRAPNFYELYYDETPGSLGGKEPSTALEPEVLRHLEADLHQELPDGLGRVAFGMFRYRIEDLISLVHHDDGDFDRYENVENVQALGAELDGRLRPGWRELELSASYTYTRAVDLATNQRLSNSPEHVLQLRADLALWRKVVYLAGAVRLLGQRLGLPGRTAAPAALTCDLILTLDEPIPGLFVDLGASNLFDERWTVPGGPEHVEDLIPQDGRSLWTRVSYAF